MAKIQVKIKFLCSGQIALWIGPKLLANTICAVIFVQISVLTTKIIIHFGQKQEDSNHRRVAAEIQPTICHQHHHQQQEYPKICDKILEKLITKLAAGRITQKVRNKKQIYSIIRNHSIKKYRYGCYILVLSILHIYQIISQYYIIYKILMSGTKATQIDPEKVIGLKVPLPNYTLTEKDVIMYALGIGFSKDPLREEDFKYTNQFHQDFTAFSTAGIIFQGGGPFQYLLKNQIMPKFNPNFVLHAEHKLIMIKNKVEIGVQYEHESEIADVVDKGKNALLFWRAKTYSRNQKNQKQLCFVQEDIFFFKGLGGFNFPGKGLIKPPVQIPKRAPDFKFLGETQPSQSFLYRLNTDLNPLHIDPKIAKSFNFQRPILHGAISYGTVARVITQELLKNDPTRIKQVQTRFIGHVYPGQSLQISVWKEGMMFIYDAVVKERKTRAIVGYLMGTEEAKL